MPPCPPQLSTHLFLLLLLLLEPFPLSFFEEPFPGFVSVTILKADARPSGIRACVSGTSSSGSGNRGLSPHEPLSSSLLFIIVASNSWFFSFSFPQRIFLPPTLWRFKLNSPLNSIVGTTFLFERALRAQIFSSFREMNIYVGIRRNGQASFMCILNAFSFVALIYLLPLM
mgnify:FL=1